MGDTDKLRPEVKEIPDEILDRAEAVYDEAIDELDGFSTCSRFALGEAIALALSEVNRPAGEPGVAIEWLRRFVVCNPVSSIETWREYSKLAAGFVETVSAELLRLADENARLQYEVESRDTLLGTINNTIRGWEARAEKAEAELAALKARMKPCARVRDGEVHVYMHTAHEGKEVAVVVVED